MPGRPPQSRRRLRLHLRIEELETRWAPHAGATPLHGSAFGNPPPSGSGSPGFGAPPPILESSTQVPVFNSVPGAAASLYLDFTGHTEATWGAYNDIDVPAYDLDGDSTTFNGVELANIESIWKRVAEDYVPFNLNVTTVAPTNFDDGTDFRVVVGGDGAWTGGVNSGISYVGSFTSAVPNVAFVFSKNLGQGNPKLVADAVSHEAGHGYGLEHQSLYDDEGDLIEEYNPGNLQRAPIMGDSYAAQRSLWWLGPTDESPDELQDDMAIIAGAGNGFGWRGDDVGDTVAAAKPLIIDGTVATGDGIIGTMTDVDVWGFTTDDGIVMFQVEVPIGINNLDVKVALLNSAGQFVVSWQDPAESCNAILVATLEAGSYELVVGSHGLYGDVGQYTVSGIIVAPGSILNGPTNLDIEAAGATQVELAWTDNADDETNYVVERSTDGDDWTEVAILEEDTTSYCDQGLDPETIYVYRVVARSERSASEYSNAAFAQTLPPVPAAPTDLIVINVTATEIHLSWSDNATNETGYVLQRSFDGEVWNTFVSLAANTNSYHDVGLAPNRPFSYRVLAVNGLSSSAATDPVTTQTLLQTPPMPTAFRLAVISYSHIDISWDDTSGIATGYLVQRTVDGVPWSTLVTLGPSVKSWSDEDLSGSTRYWYRVQALNLSVASEFTNAWSAVTPVAPPATPAQLVAAEQGTNLINLSWLDIANDETGYVVEHSFDGFSWTTLANLGANSTSYRETGLKPGTTAFYRVQALKDALKSNFTAAVAATTLPTLPRTPTMLKTARTAWNEVNLIWRDVANNESEYVVDRSLDGRNWSVAANLPAGATGYHDAGLVASTTYFYRVYAANRAGSSGVSNKASVRTAVPPTAPPTDLAVAVLNKAAILLSWQAPVGTVLKFKVQRSLDGQIWSTVATTTAATKSSKIAKPPVGRTYFYRVIAVNSGGDSDPSAAIAVNSNTTITIV